MREAGDINSAGSETSLKQLFQSMIPNDVEIMQGVVTRVTPLSIQIINDEMLTITDSNTIVPWHLTDYSTNVTIKVSQEEKLEGSITKDDPGHDHGMKEFYITKGRMTVHNGIIKGERLHIMSVNNGKQYFVLDRISDLPEA